MEKGILKEYFNDLFIVTKNGVYFLCKGSEIAIRYRKDNLLGKEITFVLLPSNKAVCLS